MARRPTRRAKLVTGSKTAGNAPRRARGAGLSFERRDPFVQDQFIKDYPKGSKSHKPFKVPEPQDMSLAVNEARPYASRIDLVRDLAFLCGHRFLVGGVDSEGNSSADAKGSSSPAAGACFCRLKAFHRLYRTRRGKPEGAGAWPIFLGGNAFRAAHLVAAVVGREQPPLPFKLWIVTETTGKIDPGHRGKMNLRIR